MGGGGGEQNGPKRAKEGGGRKIRRSRMINKRKRIPALKVQVAELRQRREREVTGKTTPVINQRLPVLKLFHWGRCWAAGAAGAAAPLCSGH